MSDELPKTPECLKLKYRYEQLLGEGSNGKTYLATDLRTGNQLAIKALKLTHPCAEHRDHGPPEGQRGAEAEELQPTVQGSEIRWPA
ncbi:MAG: hypothetical protein II767_07700, partial [Proteobacteria bacterium]|nr:hypothetical protein [Pseudomonadota bacterium]